MNRLWVKTLREENWFETSVGEPYLLQEGVWRDRSGSPRYTTAGDPYGRPGCAIGERVALYVGGRPSLVALLEITDDPQQLASEDWPWLTNAVVADVDGPTLEEIGVNPGFNLRRPRWRLTREQSDRALQAFKS